MYVRNIYLVFGVINLISFLAIMIFFLFFVKPGHQEIGLLLIFQLVGILLLSICQRRRSKLRKQGIHVLERKPVEIIIQYLLSLVNNVLCAATINMILSSILFPIEEKNYWYVGGGVLSGIFFIAIAVFALISSFFDDANDALNFLTRQRDKSKACD